MAASPINGLSGYWSSWNKLHRALRFEHRVALGGDFGQVPADGGFVAFHGICVDDGRILKQRDVADELCIRSDERGEVGFRFRAARIAGDEDIGREALDEDDVSVEQCLDLGLEADEALQQAHLLLLAD